MSSRFALRSAGVGLVLALLASVAVLGGSQTTASAQGLDTTMLLFDLSGSMNRIDSGGQSRLQVAKSAMIDAIDQLAPGSRNVGVRSFSNCGVTTLEHPPGPVDKPALSATISSLTTGNLTDIASALTAVASDFAGFGGRHTVVLLSDGAHNCSGDPCTTAEQIIASGIDLVVHAVGIGTAGTAAETQLSCIAGATGGTSISVDDAADLFDALDSALTGGATAASIVYTGTVCINSAEVQGNPALADASVGDAITDNSGARKIITTGEQCGVDCSSGFDMNCDGQLNDFCPAELDRTSVSGLAECLGIGAAPPAPKTFALLERYCVNNTGENARSGFSLPEHLVRACNHLKQAGIYEDRADQARSNGDNDMTNYWDTLAKDQAAKALAAFNDLPVPGSLPVPIPVPPSDGPTDVPTDIVDQITQILDSAPHFKYLMEAEVYWQAILNCTQENCSNKLILELEALRAEAVRNFEFPPETPLDTGWCLGLPDGHYALGSIIVSCLSVESTALPGLTEFLVDVAIGVACGAAVTASPLSAGASAVVAVVVCGALASVGGGVVDNLIDGREWHAGIASDAAWGVGGAGIGEFLGRSVRAIRNLRSLDGLTDDAIRKLCKSFSADTPVLMADGSHRAISDIEVGNMVLASDPITGVTGGREVTAIWPHEDTLLDLRVTGGTVTTTEDHHFWNATDQEWQQAQHIDIGDQLHSPDGATITVEGLDWGSSHFAAAYDLTVDDIHTYFVDAGDEDVLVHNTTGCPFAFRGDPDAFSDFGRSLHDGFDSAGYPDAEFMLQGSAVDGVRFDGGTFGPGSDFDLLTGSDDLWLEIQEQIVADPSLEAFFKPKGGDFLIDTAESADALGLGTLRNQVASEFGHVPNFVVTLSDDVLGARGIYVPYVPLGG